MTGKKQSTYDCIQHIKLQSCSKSSFSIPNLSMFSVISGDSENRFMHVAILALLRS